LPESY